jgi:hypothetical protein
MEDGRGRMDETERTAKTDEGQFAFSSLFLAKRSSISHRFFKQGGLNADQII